MDGNWAHFEALDVFHFGCTPYSNRTTRVYGATLQTAGGGENSMVAATCRRCTLVQDIGSRLRVLKFRPTRNQFPPQTVTEIMNECPNMIVDLAICIYDEELLRVLGAHVGKLALFCIFNTSPQFQATANTLTGLTEMRISESGFCSNSFKLIQDLFHGPKPNLIKLTVDCVYGVKR